MDENELERLRHLAQNAHTAMQALSEHINSLQGEQDDEDFFSKSSHGVVSPNNTQSVEETKGSRVVEGLFDGMNMLGMDGKQYTIAANYASKSKLVEGDRMKLIIAADGTFIYKQIGPIERERKVGVVEQDTTGDFVVKTEDRTYHVLSASVSYYQGQAGDEAVVLVPVHKISRWAALENVIKK